MKTFTIKQGMFLILLLMLWLFIGCTPTASISTTSLNIPLTLSSTTHFTVIPSPAISPTLPSTAPAFNFKAYAVKIQSWLGLDDKCVHFCWLGINPGVTTLEETSALLKSSKDINQYTIKETETKIEVDWNDLPIEITIEKKLVKEITLGVRDMGLTVNDLTILFGEPNQISIRLDPAYECFQLIYVLYFSSHKSMVMIPYGSWNGPNMQDQVWTIKLNTEFDFPDRQPWLGYEHMQDYFPGQELPTGLCQ